MTTLNILSVCLDVQTAHSDETTGPWLSAAVSLCGPSVSLYVCFAAALLLFVLLFVTVLCLFSHRLCRPGVFVLILCLFTTGFASL